MTKSKGESGIRGGRDVLRGTDPYSASPAQKQGIPGDGNAGRALVAGSMPERSLLSNVMEYAQANSWRTYHSWTSLHSARGFPDICLVRPPRLVFAELKSERGKLSQEQEAWLAELRQVPGVEAYLWYPLDWLSGEIERVLGRETHGHR